IKFHYAKFINTVACFAFAGFPGFLFSPIRIFFADNGISHPGMFRIFDMPIKCLQMLFLMYHLHEPSIIPSLYGFAKPILNWWFDLHRKKTSYNELEKIFHMSSEIDSDIEEISKSEKTAISSKDAIDRINDLKYFFLNIKEDYSNIIDYLFNTRNAKKFYN
ncbi:hypothetical protein BpHYR1_030507, partial [Brachionus plicatilis]